MPPWHPNRYEEGFPGWSSHAVDSSVVFSQCPSRYLYLYLTAAAASSTALSPFPPRIPICTSRGFPPLLQGVPPFACYWCLSSSSLVFFEGLQYCVVCSSITSSVEGGGGLDPEQETRNFGLTSRPAFSLSSLLLVSAPLPSHASAIPFRYLLGRYPLGARLGTARYLRYEPPASPFLFSSTQFNRRGAPN